MKRILISLLVFALFLSVLAVVGCESDEYALKADAETPEQVTEEFLARCFAGDTFGAEELAASIMSGGRPPVKEVIEFINLFEFDDYDVGEAKISGSEATVPTTMKHEEESTDFDITLYQEGGEWKVATSSLTIHMEISWEKYSETMGYDTGSSTTENIDTSQAYRDGYSDGYQKGEFEHALENWSGGRPAIDPGTGGYTTSAEIDAYEDGFWDGYEAGVEAAADAEDANSW